MVGFMGAVFPGSLLFRITLSFGKVGGLHLLKHRCVSEFFLLKLYSGMKVLNDKLPNDLAHSPALGHLAVGLGLVFTVPVASLSVC